jgi:hypothetical protein
MPAFILVFMRRVDPAYTLEQAAQHKAYEVFPVVPPTEPPAKRTAKRNGASRSSSVRSAKTPASVSTGPQS